MGSKRQIDYFNKSYNSIITYSAFHWTISKEKWIAGGLCEKFYQNRNQSVRKIGNS